MNNVEGKPSFLDTRKCIFKKRSFSILFSYKMEWKTEKKSDKAIKETMNKKIFTNKKLYFLLYMKKSCC